MASDETQDLTGYTLSNGWYSDGKFIRTVLFDGRPTGWVLWDRGSSSVFSAKVRGILAQANAGTPLSVLAQDFIHLAHGRDPLEGYRTE